MQDQSEDTDYRGKIYLKSSAITKAPVNCTLGSGFCQLKKKFIYFERGRESASMGGEERGGQRENPKQSLHCQHRAPDTGLELTKP